MVSAHVDVALARTDDGEARLPAVVAPPHTASSLPVVALLDGLPLQNHPLPAARLTVDDPDGWKVSYPARDRVHGTAMASLILYVELDGAKVPLSIPIYCRPTMRPDPPDTRIPRGESTPDDILLIDLLHRAVRRKLEGEGAAPPTARKMEGNCSPLFHLRCALPLKSVKALICPSIKKFRSGLECGLECNHDDTRSKRLMQRPGIGPVTASALLASIGAGHDFENGRQVAAWIGLTPGQHSSGGKARLGRITKAGDPYLRSLLVMGARSILAGLGDKQDGFSRWARSLQERWGYWRAVVAIAAKNARLAWAVLKYGEDFRLNPSAV